MNIKQRLIVLRDEYDLNKTRESFSEGLITYNNWWRASDNKQWFTTFIEDSIGDLHKRLNFYSVFGNAKRLGDSCEGVKIFYTGENIVSRVRHARVIEREEKITPLVRRMNRYHEAIKTAGFDMILGFGPECDDQTIRLPFWILSHFGKCYSIDDVRKKLLDIESAYRSGTSSRKGAALISTHDFFGTRNDICKSLNGILDVEFGGKWNNNSDNLWVKYNNDKEKYLSQFRFNICPENMDAEMYVTEKIWDSFSAGCIPIYGGALGNPEPKIFNRDAFILWDFDGDNLANLDKIKSISQDDQRYREMIDTPIFVEGAAEYIYSIIDGFRNELNLLLN